MDYKYYPYSNKNILNLPIKIDYDMFTNTELFLSNKNIYEITSHIIGLDTNDFNKDLNITVPKLMKIWAANKKIDEFEYVYSDKTQILNSINQEFLKDPNTKILHKDRLNVYRASIATHENIKKPYDKMTAEDYKNIDVWENTESLIKNKDSRYANQIPIWQKSMNLRHYDRSNDGLRQASFERSSLDVFQRGYDMTNIYKGTEYYKNSEFLDL
jgi:hypothetical protein